MDEVNSENTLRCLVNTIFTSIPKPPCTYTIAVAEEISSQVTMFQLLMNLLIAGAKKLYGETITPNDISNEQFEELKRYMESVGYEIKHNYTYLNDDPNIKDEDKPRVINIWFEQFVIKYDCHSRRIF
jgi:hypothetical protein